MNLRPPGPEHRANALTRHRLPQFRAFVRTRKWTPFLDPIDMRVRGTEQNPIVAQISVAECAAMESNSEKSLLPAESETVEKRIAIMVKERLSKSSGHGLDDIGRNCTVVIQRFKDGVAATKFLNPVQLLEAADSEVDKFVREKKEELWNANERLVTAILNKLCPLSDSDTDQKFVKLLKQLSFKQFVRRYSETSKQDNLEQWLTMIITRAIDSNVAVDRPEENVLSPAARQFCEARRKEIWDKHARQVAPIVRQALPTIVREFEDYYADRLLQVVVKRLPKEFPRYGTYDLYDWLETYPQRVVNELIENLTDKEGELCDEELVRLDRAGFADCKRRLLERYSTRLQKTASYFVDQCPESMDRVEFVKDVAQETSLKLVAKLDSYNFESRFSTWVFAICENEASAQGRKVRRRFKDKISREFISFEELQKEPEAPIPNEDHRALLRKVLDKHRTQGPRANKSSDANRTAILRRHGSPKELPRI